MLLINNPFCPDWNIDLGGWVWNYDVLVPLSPIPSMRFGFWHHICCPAKNIFIYSIGRNMSAYFDACHWDSWPLLWLCSFDFWISSLSVTIFLVLIYSAWKVPRVYIDVYRALMKGCREGSYGDFCSSSNPHGILDPLHAESLTVSLNVAVIFSRLWCIMIDSTGEVTQRSMVSAINFSHIVCAKRIQPVWYFCLLRYGHESWGKCLLILIPWPAPATFPFGLHRAFVVLTGIWPINHWELEK